jgi:predicted metal-dependent peptidase
MRQRTLDALTLDERRTWAAARVWAAHQAPYLASALLSLDPVVIDQSEDPPQHRLELDALPVDLAWHVYLDPEVLGQLDVPAVGFWLIHQVSHLLRHHGERYPGGTPSTTETPLFAADGNQQRWNVAADAEINDDLVAGSALRPDGAVTPDALGLPDGWTAEQYWDALGPVEAPGTTESQPGSQPTPSSADCGSGCDGQDRPWDSGTSGLGDAAQKLLERQVAHEIREHELQWGSTPAGWQRWADQILEPTVRWQQVLAAAVRRGVADVAGRVDFSYRKPSRRSSVSGEVILPSLRQPLPKVAMVLDTSGSMNDGMLAQSLAEVGGVLRSLGVAGRQLDIICCDAEAFEAQKVMRAHDVKLLGGGGTDMGAGLARADELRPRPDLIVVLTDGHTPWPPAAPKGIRVIVGLMDHRGTVPEWARAIEIGPASAA